jgi:hypothetical protein
MNSRRRFLATGAMGALAVAKADWKKMLGALDNAGIKKIFIEQDGTTADDELGAERQAYKFLLQV